MAREGEDGGELCARGEREVISWLMPDLPFLEKSVSDLRVQVGVGPGEVEAVRGVALGSEFCGGIRKFIANDAYVTGCPPYLDCRARKEQGGCGFADVVEEGGLV